MALEKLGNIKQMAVMGRICRMIAQVYDLGRKATDEFWAEKIQGKLEVLLIELRLLLLGRLQST
jgi:hypothetical protein